MAVAVEVIVDKLQSHALQSGLFETVNGHEPKRSPSNGLSAALWSQIIGPVPEQSGLSATTGLFVFYLRIYQNMLSSPQDAIDPRMIRATDTMLGLYSGDFTLGGQVKEVDLLGSSGTPLNAIAGYVSQDGKLFRVITITIPLIINDVWEQMS